MARKRAAAKTLTINRATPTSPSLLERYCRGLDGWPRSWMGWEKDLPPGEKLVARFRPFLGALVVSGLSPKPFKDTSTTFGHWAETSSAISTKTLL